MHLHRFVLTLRPMWIVVREVIQFGPRRAQIDADAALDCDLVRYYRHLDVCTTADG